MRNEIERRRIDLVDSELCVEEIEAYPRNYTDHRQAVSVISCDFRRLYVDSPLQNEL